MIIPRVWLSNHAKRPMDSHHSASCDSVAEGWVSEKHRPEEEEGEGDPCKLSAESASRDGPAVGWERDAWSHGHPCLQGSLQYRRVSMVLVSIAASCNSPWPELVPASRVLFSELLYLFLS